MLICHLVERLVLILNFCKIFGIYFSFLKIVIWGGDWKQLLPVIDNTDPMEDELTAAYHASVKTTDWFTNNIVQRHRLTRNMRLGDGQERYMRDLKCWGTGVSAKFEFGEHRTHYKEKLDTSMCVHSDEELINFVFGDALNDPMSNCDRLKGAAILCPLNKTTLSLNKEILVLTFFTL